MNKVRDIVIVSAFDRGSWLALELSKKFENVCIIDVSDSLGRWTPEDWEGPFGYFHTQYQENSSFAVWAEGESVRQSRKGISFWLKEGPLELKGPLYKFKRQKLEISEYLEDYITNFKETDKNTLKSKQESILNTEFKSTWLAHMSHQLAGNVWRENYDAISPTPPLPLFSKHSFKTPSHSSRIDRLTKLSDMGVEVWKNSKILDLIVEKKDFQGIEVKSGGASAIIQSKNWIWMLSSEESQWLNSSMTDVLFNSAVLEPEWVWVRYRLKWEKNLAIQSIPSQFIFIKNLNLPWGHENLVYCNQGIRDNEWDCWIRIPRRERFRKDYLEMTKNKLVNEFYKRVPTLKLASEEFPQEYKYSYDELGPARFPIFNGNDFKKLIRNDFDNLIWDGPEKWNRLDVIGMLDRHSLIKQKLVSQ